MLEKATIARPYAEAAFSQAIDEVKLNEWSVFLDNLKNIVSDEGMIHVIASPKLDQQQLTDFIVDIGAVDVFRTSPKSFRASPKLGQHQSLGFMVNTNALDGSRSAENFIRILVEAERIVLAPEIFTLFEQHRAAAQGISDVNVISAYPLDDNQVADIGDAISKRLAKEVNIETSEDKSLIGGIVIRSGDAVIDASVRGRLKQLNNIFAQ